MICRKVRTFLLVVIFSGIALACDPWFSCSPYEANLDEGYHNTTASNLAAINELDTDDSRPFKVAVLSDTHYHFSKLQDAINHINQQGDYSFAIVTGDISENGLKQEFVYFYNVMTNLKIPYLTTIGNHDYLSNGEKIYAQMFGPSNYSFVFNNVKFIVFDNTTFESEKEPDMAWLREEFEDDRAYDHVVPFAHVPPFDKQMKQHQADYHALMAENHISYSVHGHKHDFSVSESYGDGVRYVTVSSPQKRTYTQLEFNGGSIEVRKIEY